MSKAKEIIDKIRALFADVPPAPPATPVMFSYPIDGGSTVFVDCSDDGMADIDANDKVYTDAAGTTPYPDGTYKVTGKDFSFTVAGGMVTAVTDADGTGPGLPLEQAAPDPMDASKKPAPPPAPPAPPAPSPITPPAKFEMTPEGAKAFMDKFADGTPDDRIANLEVVCKALMEYNFGWQIREAQQKATADAAIEVYKQDLVTAQAALTAQDVTIKKQEEKLKALFSLTEELAAIPVAEPQTLTGPKKEKFEKKQKTEDRFSKIADSLKQLKNK